MHVSDTMQHPEKVNNFSMSINKSITGSLLGAMNWVHVYTFDYLDHLKEIIIPVSGLLGYLVP